MKKILFFAIFSFTCFAESPIIIGVRGGVPLGDVIQAVQSNSGASSSTDNYVVGPTIGVRLPFDLSVTADALYTRLNFSFNSTSVSASSNAFEFPVMVRFTPGQGTLRPYVGAGVSVRHISDLGNAGAFVAGSNGSLQSSPSVGLVVGGGLDVKVGRLHLSPEIRYTHWNSNDVSSALRNVLRLNDNEGQILVGLTF